MSVQTPPRSVAWFGYGGLLPFIGLALATLLDPAHALLWRGTMIAYGAVILSFVGALHWGFAMTLVSLTPLHRTVAYAWSVVPALLGWVALLLPAASASAVLVAGFIVHYAFDRQLVRRTDLPAWYLPLRLRLTAVACVCLTSIAGRMTL
jgi:hypothetical protein